MVTNRETFEAKIEEIVNSKTLTRKEKIRKLKKWEYDARELQVADEENMTGPELIPLDIVIDGLKQLGAVRDPDHTGPTKQGASI